MRLFPSREREPDVPPAEEPTPAPEFVFGYECPCGTRIESRDERELTENAWAHARRCHDEIHADARDADPTYGHPDHFVYEAS